MVINRFALFFARFSHLVQLSSKARSDWVGPLCLLTLAFFGVIFIHSAQSYTNGNQWAMQIFWFILGLGTYGLISLVDYKLYLNYAHYIYGFSVILLLLLWTPLGVSVAGAQRWLNLRVFYVQPSDMAKIGTLIFAAAVLSRSKITHFRHSAKAILKVSGVFLAPTVLIFLQPDLGSCLIFVPLFFSLLYASNLSWPFFVSTFLVALIVFGLLAVDISGYAKYIIEHREAPATSRYQDHALLPLKDYQRNRVLAFVAPDVIDPQGINQNWNLRQSLIAIGSGGLTGKGSNQGTQAKLGYLPQKVAPNDFIFSVVAEEAGFIGGSFVILLYALLVGTCIRAAIHARDRFGTLLSAGISVIFMVHIFVNIGMTIGLMPITGIPLPFLSYGGSFVISCCILMGLVQSVYRFRKNF